MRVSVVIPTYNAAAFLRDAITSVRAQTRAPDELLVIDDASRDGSVAVARALGATVLVQPVNRGPSAARNAAVAAATGDVVAFLDADDAWLPGHIAWCVGALQKHPDAAIACTAAVGWEVTPPPVGAPSVELVDDPLVRLIADPFIPQTAAVVRRAAVLETGGYDERLRHAEDFDLWLRIAERHAVARVRAAGVRRREHPGQASRAVLSMVASGATLRLRTLALVEQTGDAGRTERARAALRRALELDLHAAWYSRDLTALDHLLAVAAGVPGGDTIARRWALRRRVAWHAYHALRDVKRLVLRRDAGPQ